jgi:hypothetical protein
VPPRAGRQGSACIGTRCARAVRGSQVTPADIAGIERWRVHSGEKAPISWGFGRHRQTIPASRPSRNPGRTAVGAAASLPKSPRRGRMAPTAACLPRKSFLMPAIVTRYAAIIRPLIWARARGTAATVWRPVVRLSFGGYVMAAAADHHLRRGK